MLSDYFYCGLVTGGAMLGVAQLARAVPRDRDPDVDTRSLAILMAAFAEGLGVLAIMIGFMTTFVADDAGGTAAAAAALVPALVLGVPALVMLRLRELPTELVGTRGLVIILAAFAAGLGVLVLIVALIALLLEYGAGATGIDPLVMVFAVVGAVAGAAVGYFGAEGIRALRGDRTLGGTPVDVAAVRSRTLIRAAVAQGIGVITLVVVMMLMIIAA